MNNRHNTVLDESKRILIVDDNSMVRRLLALIVGLIGHQSLTAHNGKDALERVAIDKIDLILLDIMMPGGIDGFEVCRQIKADPLRAHIPIIIITALNDATIRQKGISLGAIEVVSKPFSNEVLMTLVQESLHEQKIDVAV